LCSTYSLLPVDLPGFLPKKPKEPILFYLFIYNITNLWFIFDKSRILDVAATAQPAGFA